MKALKEHSYGIIPLKESLGVWQVLLVQHREGHWTFPKGHPEGKETAKETARRELLEETSLEIKRFLPLQEEKESYHFTRDEDLVEKQAEYFYALVQGEVKIQEEELKGGLWVSLEDLEDKASFPESKKLFTKVAKGLASLKKGV